MKGLICRIFGHRRELSPDCETIACGRCKTVIETLARSYGGSE